MNFFQEATEECGLPKAEGKTRKRGHGYRRTRARP